MGWDVGDLDVDWCIYILKQFPLFFQYASALLRCICLLTDNEGILNAQLLKFL